jgi:hypothetical protein
MDRIGSDRTTHMRAKIPNRGRADEDPESHCGERTTSRLVEAKTRKETGWWHARTLEEPDLILPKREEDGEVGGGGSEAGGGMGGGTEGWGCRRSFRNLWSGLLLLGWAREPRHFLNGPGNGRPNQWRIHPFPGLLLFWELYENCYMWNTRNSRIPNWVKKCTNIASLRDW